MYNAVNNNYQQANIYQTGYSQNSGKPPDNSPIPHVNRPISAGAIRSRNGNFSYNRHNTGNSNLNNVNLSATGLLGQSYGSNLRPSSAGYSKNTSRKEESIPVNNAVPISHILSAHHIPNITQPPIIQQYQNQQFPSTSRPKSAGAVRRTTDNQPQIYANNINNTNVQNQQYQMYLHHQQQQQDYEHSQQTATAATSFKTAPKLNHYNVSGNAFPQGQVPASSGTTDLKISYQLPNDHWGATYKAQNGYNHPNSNTPQVTVSTTSVQNINYGVVPVNAHHPTTTTAGGSGAEAVLSIRPTSSSAIANKLRIAVELDVAVNVPNNTTIAAITDDDNFDAGIDAEYRKKEDTALDDDEMDGKPIDISRSHPEISLTTASASLELGHLGGTSQGGFDMRGISVDSYAESQILVGLSTVPNQFCTKHDAIELKKLLQLSAGTRGGIVPSSSAVMDMYMVGKVVGVGSYGKVRAAWHRLTSSKVAIKTYDKAKLKDPSHWKRVHSEIKIMEQVSHPRIARMYEAVETPKRMHLIMECLDGGNLCSYVKAKRRLSEEESKRIFFQIMQAIEYLHGLGVSHRDVKLENVLFANDKEIKLIDFGFSTVCQPGKRLKVFCGTPSYMAPEIVRRTEYEGKPVDMWSMGILLYALLCGCFPFRAKAYPDLYRRIARGTFPIPEELSAPVKDLLKQLLNIDATTRINAHTALRHTWLQTQLINSPNMDKIRLETAILISDKPSDDLDDEVISELEKFGMTKDEVVRLVLTKTHCSLATLYYLLLDTLVNRRKTMQLQQRPVINSYGNNNIASTTTTTSSRPQTAGSYRKYTGANNSSNTHIIAMNPNTTTAGIMGMQNAQMQAVAAANVSSFQDQQEKSNAQYNQQKLTEQMMNFQLQQQQQQQQQAQDRQEYKLRPKSASQTRVNNSNQRPLSAFAGRR